VFCAACVGQVSALTGHEYQECLKGLIGRVSCCSSPLPYVRAIRSFPPAGGQVWRANGEHAFIVMLRGEAAVDEGEGGARRPPSRAGVARYVRAVGGIGHAGRHPTRHKACGRIVDLAFIT
jgi:hypothetical protein